MTSTRIFSGSKHNAIKKSFPVGIQVCKAYSEDKNLFEIVLYPKEERKRGAGVKQQIIQLSKEEVKRLAENLNDIISI